VDNARDPAGWKQLRLVLLRWRFHADAMGDPGYREALDAARGPAGSGMLARDEGFIEIPENMASMTM